MVLTSFVVNLVWSALTLGKWSFSEAPSWGFVAISSALSAAHLGLHAATSAIPVQARAARAYYATSLASYYERLASWLALLGAWRTLWPDEPIDQSASRWRRLGEAQRAALLRGQKGKRERHFFSLIGSFALWGVTSAAAPNAQNAARLELSGCSTSKYK